MSKNSKTTCLSKEDQEKLLSNIHNVLSKNHELIHLMNRKFALDVERDRILNQKERKYNEFITRFDNMGQTMDHYEKRMNDMIKLLRAVRDSMRTNSKLTRAELNDKLSDIFNQL